MRRYFLLLLLLCTVLAGGISLLFCAHPNAPETDATTTADAAEHIPVASDPLSPSLQFVSNGNGTCTVIGIASSAGQQLIIPAYSPGGDRVSAIAPRAFYGNSEIHAIHIPSTVLYIGDLALADCQNLALVSVSADSPSYCSVNGVLYSKDRATLLLYPPALGGRTVSIEKATTTIAEMAFYQCRYPTELVYHGTPAEWEAITIAPRNYSLTALSKQFIGE